MRIKVKDISLDLKDIPESPYLLEENFLIFDIETTGFSRKYAIIYMIGCILKTKSGYKYYNIFASDPSKEPELIQYFFTLLKDVDLVIHYNGDRFDIPFLLSRAEKHGMKDQISHIKSIDIYNLLRPFRKNLGFPDLKLDTIQAELGYKRKDIYSGGDLIPIYKNYTKKPYEPYYDLLLLHNTEDVVGMLSLLPIIDTTNLIQHIIESQTIEALSVKQDEAWVNVCYTMPTKALTDFKLVCSWSETQMILKANNDQLQLTIPLYQDTKKFFFENYKDYMYIPDQDQVMHKSIARYIAPDKKQRVNKRDCYVSQTGEFMPVFKLCSTLKKKPRLFRDSLRSKEEYTVVSDELDMDFYKSQIVGFLTTLSH